MLKEMREGRETGPLPVLADKGQAHRLSKLYSVHRRRKQSCFLIDGMQRYCVAGCIDNQEVTAQGIVSIPFSFAQHGQ